MRISKAAADKLGLTIDRVHSEKVKANKRYGGALCENLLASVKKLTGVEGVPEHVFHPTRKWRMDAAWPEQQVAVELQGWMSHHRRGRMEADNIKLAAAVRLGWKVFYATAEQIKNGTAALWVAEVLERGRN